MEKPIAVRELLASSLGRKDESPNVELAEAIVQLEDREAISELIALLQDSTKAIQNDVIKVLYEIGERQAELISPYLEDFLPLLSSKNNRLQWGGMTALNCITQVSPGRIYPYLPEILTAAEKGSVITRDQAVNLLIRLAGDTTFQAEAFPLLMEQLLSSPTNQFPMYAERAFPIIDGETKNSFLELLQLRVGELEKESKRKRVEKVIRKLHKIPNKS